MNSLTVNGRAYTRLIRRSRKASSCPWADGYFQVRGRGVLLMDAAQAPFAYACGNDPAAPFMVTAFLFESDGRLRYMHALTPSSADRLGVALATLAEDRRVAASILEQAGL